MLGFLTKFALKTAIKHDLLIFMKLESAHNNEYVLEFLRILRRLTPIRNSLHNKIDD